MLINKKAWYAITVQGGKEIKIRDWLITNKDRFGVSDDVLDNVMLPVKRKIIVKNGKKKITETSLIGPYVYVHANICDESVISFFTQAPSVYSFVGSRNGGFRSGADVISDSEMDKIINNNNDEVNGNENQDLLVGDAVEIISGSFSNFKGIVKDINKKNNILKIGVMIFGGENIIEVKTFQVKKIDNYE